ncbi:MAG: hypothetical protein ABIR30_03550 [Chitinophagaceae bacterium]
MNNPPANTTVSKDKKTLSLSSWLSNTRTNPPDTLVISKDGRQIDGAFVVSNQKIASGDWQIVTEKKGIDGNDNKAAVIRHIYSIGSRNFINRKEV